MIKDKCHNCEGEGRVQGEEDVKIDIPAGVEEGNYLPLEGKGNAGRRGGAAGDLIVVMEVKEHDTFTRNGNNLLYRATVSIADAVLGTELDIPTIMGSEKLKVEAGTQPGETIRMKGKGLPSLDTGLRGDQVVFVDVFIPKKINAAEKQKLKELQKSENFSPKAKKENKHGFFDRVKDMF